MKADKVLNLLKEAEPGSPEFHPVHDLMGMIAELVDEFTSGRASDTKNPYSRPVIKKALKMLADESGIKDPMDVDLKKLMKR